MSQVKRVLDTRKACGSSVSLVAVTHSCTEWKLNGSEPQTKAQERLYNEPKQGATQAMKRSGVDPPNPHPPSRPQPSDCLCFLCHCLNSLTNTNIPLCFYLFIYLFVFTFSTPYEQTQCRPSSQEKLTPNQRCKHQCDGGLGGDLIYD